MTAPDRRAAAMGAAPSEAMVDAVLARTTARLLAAAAAVLGATALLCAALAAWRLWHTSAPAGPALAVWALLPIERVLALRLHLDARLFADLADARDGRASLQALDQALARLRLRAPAAHTRPLAERVRGARRLLAWHAATACAQVALLATALLTAPR